jgi:hypothetical protein
MREINALGSLARRSRFPKTLRGKEAVNPWNFIIEREVTQRLRARGCPCVLRKSIITL